MNRIQSDSLILTITKGASPISMIKNIVDLTNPVTKRKVIIQTNKLPKSHLLKLKYKIFSSLPVVYGLLTNFTNLFLEIQMSA